VARHAVDAQHFALVAPDLLFAFGDEIEMLHLIDGHPDESSILKFPFAATFTRIQLAIISHINRSLTAGQNGFRQPDAGPHIPERIATPISDIVVIAGHPRIMLGASIVIIRAANRVGQNFSMLTIEAPTGFDDLLKGARIEVFPAVFLVQRAAATRRGVVSGAPKGCLDVGISELGACGVGSVAASVTTGHPAAVRFAVRLGGARS